MNNGKQNNELEGDGLLIRPLQPSMKRRAQFHDYSVRGVYMLTLVVEGRRGLLGRLELGDGAAEHGTLNGGNGLEGRLGLLGRLELGDGAAEHGTLNGGNGLEGRRGLLGRLILGDGAAEHGTLNGGNGRGGADGSGSEGRLAHIELSALGKAILREEIGKINRFYPQVEVWKVCIMPDHIHLIVRVKENLPRGKHLGHVVCGFKTGCNQAFYSGDEAARHGTLNGGNGLEGRRGLPGGLELGDGAARHGTLNRGRGLGKASLRAGLFERGYNDRLLFDGEQLERWKHYLDDNPRRLAVKRLHPDLFVVRRGMRIAGRDCQIVGNQFLLDIPDKVAVIVHRVDSDEVFARKKAEWLSCGERGGVIVSAAIAKREKEVMREAMERGYCLILLRENGFSEFYKPVGEAFDACARGQLLQVSPWAFHTASSTISRGQCLELNCLAEDIVVGVGEKSNGCNSE